MDGSLAEVERNELHHGEELFGFLKSTTITLMLSLLPRATASSANTAAASATWLSFATFSEILFILPPKHLLTMLQAISFETTSHRPSLPSMRNSSLLVRLVTVTSGLEITNGLRYSSPARELRRQFENLYLRRFPKVLCREKTIDYKESCLLLLSIFWLTSENYIITQIELDKNNSHIWYNS